MARRPRRTNDSLDARSGAILRAVIDEYVTSAVPVSSGSLVAHYALGVSSATVRSILADLEALGLLTHPHTSAGRVPTDAGYRYYVQVLADDKSLPPVEQRMIRHQFGQVEFASEQWFRLAASTLAANTGTAGMATTAKPKAARVRRVELLAVQDRLALMIVVFREGTTKQVLHNLSSATDQDAAEPGRRAAERAGSGPDRRRDRGGPGGPADRRRRQRRVGDPARQSASGSCAPCASSTPPSSTTSSATACSTSWPRRSSTAARRSARSSRRSRTGLSRLAGGERRRAGSIQIFIGHENSPLEMQDVSLILAPYGRIGRAVGVVGVLGPTRMPYPQAIASVEFVSGLMNELVEHLYA
jgi:heat-inducible transcriptional repressor